MKRSLIIIALVVAMASAMWLAHGATMQTGGTGAPPAAIGGGGGFVPVDVYLDTGTKHLAAYQLELIAKDAKIVGLEGGDSTAFSKAPFYDPAALAGPGGGASVDKIIVAAFSTDDNLPMGMTRVARLHLLMNDGAPAVGANGAKIPEITRKLIVATDAQGQSIEAEPSLRLMQGDTR